MSTTDRQNLFTFWGCFIALVTTSTAFITRAFLVNIGSLWPAELGLDKVQAGELFGAGIWPFAISIILFSLIIDRIGYRVAMFFSFGCYAAYTLLALLAHFLLHKAEADREAAYRSLYWGSVILGLGNGTVEAFINPVVATLFSRQKTKWLNILHAGWPAGLVLGGVAAIALQASAERDWRILIYLLAAPAVVYVAMLRKAVFPVNERVAAGTSYREMLAEFGAGGAAIAAFLVVRQLGEPSIFNWSPALTGAIVAALVVAYGLYSRSLGRPMLLFLCLVMLPLATTELGTDGAITGIMEEPLKAAGQHPIWVLVYTSAVMMVLRFCAGPIVHRLSPVGLLSVCSALAICGLFALSQASGLAMIFAAATLYGVGKTFFWPTMLGIAAEQCPKGGALTLNALAGIGMLSAGILGTPLIGAMQEDSAREAIELQKPGLYAKIAREEPYFFGTYHAIDPDKLKTLDPLHQRDIQAIATPAKQGALARMTVFPAAMLLCYLALALHFRNKGGYRPVDLAGAEKARESEPGM
ncbi:MAG TPA: MFS transporter [Luteolibacter sp.]